MSRTHQLLCAHSAWAFAVLLALGIFGIAGWMPLIEPGMGAQDLAAHYAANRNRIRVGVSVTAFAGIFWWSMSAAIAMQMKRIEGASHPLTYVQLAASSGTAMIVFLTGYIWLAAAFRPDIPPDTLRALNDLAWLCFVGFYPPAFIQNVAIGLCILGDRGEPPVYPRWVGYMNLWLAILFLPGALLAFFQRGPFSWNGLIGFWLVAIVFFGWIIVMWHMTVKAIRSDPTLG